MIVLIPAYEPGEALVGLVERFRAERPDLHVLVVDDGSGPDHHDIFDRVIALGALVVGEQVNRGKGYALKRGFACAEQWFPGHDVVCADCDGQHTVRDVLRVADEVQARPDTIVLGGRRFTGRVPFASRAGNAVTRVLFARATGVRLFDTQTGLRGYPASMLPWLQRIGGDRFEYELRVLLHATEDGMRIHETSIDTVYLDENASSHFRPLVDSARVYAPLVRFGASSLSAFAIDAAVLFVMMAATQRLLLSAVVARVVSATWNFSVNRRVVFRGPPDRPLAQSLRRYGLLALGVLVANYALLRLLRGPADMPLAPAKLLTEVVLFLLSYAVQARLVFGGRHARAVATVGSAVRAVR